MADGSGLPRVSTAPAAGRGKLPCFDGAVRVEDCFWFQSALGGEAVGETELRPAPVGPRLRLPFKPPAVSTGETPEPPSHELPQVFNCPRR